MTFMASVKGQALHSDPIPPKSHEASNQNDDWKESIAEKIKELLLR